MPPAEDPRYQISVQAQSVFIREQSQPEKDRYAFAYTITIRNTGFIAARLLNRHWIITDANGRVQEVRGEGVVGEPGRIRSLPNQSSSRGTYPRSWTDPFGSITLSPFLAWRDRHWTC